MVTVGRRAARDPAVNGDGMGSLVRAGCVSSYTASSVPGDRRRKAAKAVSVTRSVGACVRPSVLCALPPVPLGVVVLVVCCCAVGVRGARSVLAVAWGVVSNIDGRRESPQRAGEVSPSVASRPSVVGFSDGSGIDGGAGGGAFGARGGAFCLEGAALRG